MIEGKKVGRLEGRQLTVESGKMKEESFSSNNYEIPQEQLTDTNLSTFQLFNHSTDTNLPSYPHTFQPSNKRSILCQQ